VTRNAVASLGFDQDAAMVTFPIELFLADSDLGPVAKAADQFVSGLTAWRSAVTETGVKPAPALRIEAPDESATLRRVNDLFLAERWGDGLPLYPPTEDLVAWILKGTDLAPDHIIGRVMPRGGIATVKAVAATLAMAGGRPEYLALLIAAVEAILDPAMEHEKFQANSGSPFPVVVVNGPMAEAIGLNSGFGLLGPDPDHPAGASIGRAIRLILQNIGGALPGDGTMAAYAAMRFTNAVFAEDEAGLPSGWPTVAAEMGKFGAGFNAVTVFCASGGVNIPRRAISPDVLEDEIMNGLHRTAGYLRVPGRDYVTGWANGTPGALLISRTVAGQLASLGWTKDAVRAFLWEHSKIAATEVERTGLTEWIRSSPDAAAAAAPTDPWPICRRPEQILLAVAGGAHPTNHLWFQGEAPAVVTREIRLPKDWAKMIAVDGKTG